MKNLKIALKKSPSLKVLGICYGHQLVAKMFGGVIEKRPRFGGIENIIYEKEIIEKFKFLYPLIGRKLNLVCEHHEDFVTTIPEELYLLADSNSC